MTRDEAIKKLYECSNEPVGLGEDWASFEVDKYVALGILKLDEPVSKIAAIDSIIRRHAEQRVADCIMGALRNSKLIEK